MVTDNDLIFSLREGDDAAFKEIYRRYWYKLYGIVKRRIQSEEDSEEIIQDIFLDLWDRRESVQIAELDRFLFTAAKYKVLNYIKSQIVRQSYQTDTLKIAEDTDSNTEELLALNDLSEAVSAGLDGLPEKTREIFRLNRLEGHSVKEVAQILHIPERTVEYHITQSLRFMRVYLRDFVAYTASVLLFLYLRS